MGIVYNEVKVSDLFRYEPEYNRDGSEKHIICDGARYHVVSYHYGPKGTSRHCSEPNCEINRRREQSENGLEQHNVTRGK